MDLSKRQEYNMNRAWQSYQKKMEKLSTTRGTTAAYQAYGIDETSFKQAYKERLETGGKTTGYGAEVFSENVLALQNNESRNIARWIVSEGLIPTLKEADIIGNLDDDAKFSDVNAYLKTMDGYAVHDLVAWMIDNGYIANGDEFIGAFY